MPAIVHAAVLHRDFHARAPVHLTDLQAVFAVASAGVLEPVLSSEGAATGADEVVVTGVAAVVPDPEVPVPAPAEAGAIL